MYAVELKSALTKDNIENILSDINVNFELKIVSAINITSISDGRMPVSGSICYVESIDGLIKKNDVIYILSELVTDVSCVVVDDPRSVFIKLLSFWQKTNFTYSLSPEKRNSSISESTVIHPAAVLEDEVTIGHDTIISAGCVIKRGTSIGSNCIVRENTVIGCDGIALYKNKEGEVLRFPHLSGVDIGDNVEIGASCVLVKGTLKPTKVEDDVVIGNLCNIGHGVLIERKTWISVGTLVGGNCEIETNSTIGLGVSIKDNLVVSEGASIGMGTVLTKSTTAQTSYFGNPAKPIRRIKTGPVR